MYKILIADDEDLERKSLRLFFERNFPELQLLPDAINGAEVVERVLHQKPDILILDIEMPGLNGLEALRIIRQANSSIKVIVKTAYSKFSYAKEALNLHVDYFLLKPVKKEEMKDCIEQLLKQLPGTVTAKHDTSSENPISKIALLSSIIHNWAEKEQIYNYVQNLNLSFASGFVILTAFPNINSIDTAKLVALLMQNLSVISDYVVGSFENGILPIMFFYSEKISEDEYQKIRQELSSLIYSWVSDAFSTTPVISSGELVHTDITLIQKSYQSALKQIKALPNYSIADTKGNESLKKALTYIHEYYYEDLSLERVADYSRLNPSYLSHLFKDTMHKNYTDYLNEYRITQAIRLMQDGIINVNELAERVGYAYPSYFCKLFKKYTGHTISNFKKDL